MPKSSTSKAETSSLGPLPAQTVEESDPTLREELYEAQAGIQQTGQVQMPAVRKSAQLHHHGGITTTREEPDMES